MLLSSTNLKVLFLPNHRILGSHRNEKMAHSIGHARIGLANNEVYKAESKTEIQEKSSQGQVALSLFRSGAKSNHMFKFNQSIISFDAFRERKTTPHVRL